MSCIRVPQKYAKWMALVGGVLIHLTFGTLYTFGNLSPYLTSYLRYSLKTTDIHYSSTAWIFSLATVSQGAFMPLAGVIEKRLGSRPTCFIGCLLFTTGVFLTSFAVKWSYYAVLFTYGVIFGGGIGIAYPVCISCAVKWFPAQKATVTGVIVFGFGMSTLLFNFVQTLLINPNNLNTDSVDPRVANEFYYSQTEVLDRVPLCFLVLAVIYMVVQVIGLLLLNEPESESDDHSMLVRSEDHDDFVIPQSQPLPPLHEDFSRNNYLTVDVKPSQVLRSKHFYMLYAMFFCNQMTVNFIGALYKAFGQTFIKDDFYLALIGSISSVFNATGRLAWGWLTDRTSCKFTIFVLACCNASLLFSIYSCLLMGKAAYFIWVCLVYFVFSGMFSICPAAIAKLFGTKYLSSNYGLLFTAAVPAGLFTATLSSLLLEAVGYFPMFCICATSYVIAATIAFFFNAKTPYGGEV